MKLLDAINIILTHGAGIHRISSTDDARAAEPKDAIESARMDALLSDWPFNRETITLSPQTTGEVKLAANVLKVELPHPYIVRTRKVYDPDDRTFILNETFTDVNAMMDVAYDDLPETVQRWIAWSAAAQFAAAKRGAGNERFAYCQDRAGTYEVRIGLDYPAYPEDYMGAPGYGFPFGGTERSSWRWCECS